MSELRGRIALLRPLAAGDAEALRTIHASPEVSAWWGSMDGDFPFDEPEVTRYTIVVDGQVAGLIQWGEETEPDYRHAWIDIFVGPAFAGRGIGTDAIVALVDHLFTEHDHHRVTIDPALANAAAIRSYEKAGFRRIGVMQAAERAPDGHWRDALFMERVDPRVLGSDG